MFLYALSSIDDSPFRWDAEKLATAGIHFTPDKGKADVLVTTFLPPRNMVHGIRFRIAHGNRKPVLLWSREPYGMQYTKPVIRGDFLYPETYVMNLYTGGVYRSSPGSNFGNCADAPLSSMKVSELHEKSHFCAAVVGYVANLKARRFIVGGKDIDLSRKRQELVIHGYRLDQVDVYGPGWPGEISRGNSRTSSSWVEEKLRLLRDYRFNICLENTGYPLYITEKIWHAIKARCLPVYSSFNSSIYEVFKPGSFVDCEDFGSFDELYAYLRSMPDREYLERYNSLVESYNVFVQSHDHEVEEQWMREQIIAMLSRIVEAAAKAG